MFKSNRSGSSFIDWSKVDRAPVEVIDAIKGNLPHIIAQMPYNEQMELLGNYHMKTSNFDNIVNDVKAAINKDATQDDSASIQSVSAQLGELNKTLNVIKSNAPKKWFK